MTQWGLDALFNPAKRHMDEEKRRLQSTREEIGDSSGGKRIDFESGKVTIRRSTPRPDAADDASDEMAGDEGAADETVADEMAADEGAADEGAADEGAADEGAADETPAREGDRTE